MFFLKTFLFFILINISFTSISISSEPKLREVYFKKKEVVASNLYTKIIYNFLDEISGSSNEIIYQLRKIDASGNSYYKVSYDKNNNIYGYQFFKGGSLISYAKYLYLSNKSKLKRIDYFTDKSNLIMSEHMIYDDDNHKIIQTKRHLYDSQ